MKRCIGFCLALLSACGVGDTGRVQVFVEPEDSIPDGLEPGTDDENIRDGWTVSYQKYLIAIGNFRASRSGGGTSLRAPEVHVVDLLNVPAGGLVIATFDDVPARRFDQVGFDLPNSTPAALRADGTSPADYDFMVAGGYSIYVEGSMTKPDGQSCLPSDPEDCVAASTVTFRWGLRAGTSFDSCAPSEGAAGFAVPSGGTTQIKPTIHGDHWFFTNVTQGAEITARRAQWIADCDLDRDHETTLAELASVPVADVFPPPLYNLSGSIIPLITARDFLETQVRTLGDFQGDGECPVRELLP